MHVSRHFGNTLLAVRPSSSYVICPFILVCRGALAKQALLQFWLCAVGLCELQMCLL